MKKIINVLISIFTIIKLIIIIILLCITELLNKILVPIFFIFSVLFYFLFAIIVFIFIRDKVKQLKYIIIGKENTLELCKDFAKSDLNTLLLLVNFTIKTKLNCESTLKYSIFYNLQYIIKQKSKTLKANLDNK